MWKAEDMIQQIAYCGSHHFFAEIKIYIGQFGTIYFEKQISSGEGGGDGGGGEGGGDGGGDGGGGDGGGDGIDNPTYVELSQDMISGHDDTIILRDNEKVLSFRRLVQRKYGISDTLKNVLFYSKTFYYGSSTPVLSSKYRAKFGFDICILLYDTSTSKRAHNYIDTDFLPRYIPHINNYHRSPFRVDAANIVRTCEKPSGGFIEECSCFIIPHIDKNYEYLDKLDKPISFINHFKDMLLKFQTNSAEYVRNQPSPPDAPFRRYNYGSQNPWNFWLLVILKSLNVIINEAGNIQVVTDESGNRIHERVDIGYDSS